MLRCNIRGLSRVAEGRGVKLDDGVERKFRMWMICEPCWRGRVYAYMEQRKARKAPQLELSITPSAEHKDNKYIYFKLAIYRRN